MPLRPALLKYAGRVCFVDPPFLFVRVWSARSIEQDPTDAAKARPAGPLSRTGLLRYLLVDNRFDLDARVIEARTAAKIGQRVGDERIGGVAIGRVSAP